MIKKFNGILIKKNKPVLIENHREKSQLVTLRVVLVALQLTSEGRFSDSTEVHVDATDSEFPTWQVKTQD